MVQLKGKAVVAIMEMCFVSIPYGSIKSVSKVEIGAVGVEFQFLMVQLKALRPKARK